MYYAFGGPQSMSRKGWCVLVGYLTVLSSSCVSVTDCL